MDSDQVGKMVENADATTRVGLLLLLLVASFKFKIVYILANWVLAYCGWVFKEVNE